MKTTEITKKSYGHIKVNGVWYEEISKNMIGLSVISINTREGKTFLMSEIELR